MQGMQGKAGQGRMGGWSHGEQGQKLLEPQACRQAQRAPLALLLDMRTCFRVRISCSAVWASRPVVGSSNSSMEGSTTSSMPRVTLRCVPRVHSMRSRHHSAPVDRRSRQHDCMQLQVGGLHAVGVGQPGTKPSGTQSVQLADLCEAASMVQAVPRWTR